MVGYYPQVVHVIYMVHGNKWLTGPTFAAHQPGSWYSLARPVRGKGISSGDWAPKDIILI